MQQNRYRKTEESKMPGTAGSGMPGLSLRELYYHGVFERKLFSVEDVLADLHNRRIDADIAAGNGDLDASSYAEILSEIEAAEDYFHAGVSAAWFEDAGFQKDEEGRVTQIDGEEVMPLPVEKTRAGMEAFLKLMRKNDEEEITLRRVYEAGVFRYGDFTVEEAAVDVHNRLLDAWLLLDREAERLEEHDAHAASISGAVSETVSVPPSVYALRKTIAELKEAKAWADRELVEVHFLTANAKKDAYGRYTSVGGHPVIPIDVEKLRDEYEEYLRMAIRRHELGNGSVPRTGIG